MEESEIFRFPEEAEREERLRGMAEAELSRIAAKLPNRSDVRDEKREAVAILTVLEREIARFLASERGKTDVFGNLRNSDGFYADFCRMQSVLHEGVGRLEAIQPQKADPIPIDRYDEWAVTRLAEGLHPDASVTEAADALLQKIRRIQARSKQTNERTLQLRERLRVFLRETVPAYCGRSLQLSDAANGGKALRAGQLSALVGELKTAISETIRAIEAI